MNFLSPIVIAEEICLIVAFIFLIRDKSLFWKLNIVYLFIALVAEGYGSHLSLQNLHNLKIFNTFILLEIAFISYGMYHCLKKYINPGPIIFIGLGINYVTFLYFLANNYQAYNDVFAFTTVNVFSVIFTIYALYFYYQVLKANEPIDLKNNAEFWWVSGVLFYYFGGTVVNVFNHYLNMRIVGRIPLRLIIYYITNFILYSNWIYSYICRMKQRKLSL